MPCDTATRSTSRFVFAELATPSSAPFVMKVSAATGGWGAVRRVAIHTCHLGLGSCGDSGTRGRRDGHPRIAKKRTGLSGRLTATLAVYVRPNPTHPDAAGEQREARFLRAGAVRQRGRSAAVVPPAGGDLRLFHGLARSERDAIAPLGAGGSRPENDPPRTRSGEKSRRQGVPAWCLAGVFTISSRSSGPRTEISTCKGPATDCFYWCRRWGSNPHSPKGTGF
jgi:hypothetical protein